jgi:peptidoglycan/xylan/chitin deacetylase (PgdA/CDA1 family)
MKSTQNESTDHGYYRREPITRRKTLRWPNGAVVAVAVVVNAEYYEMRPPLGAFIPPNLPGGFGRGPYPDFRNYSARAYGNRVGIFRIFEALDRYGMRATVALDALTAVHCPQLLPHIRRRGFEIIAHGQSVTRMISSRMSLAEEREYIRSALATIEQATGTMPSGWHGPEYGESAQTPAILAELGLRYVLDWPNDEQPVSMTTSNGSIVSVPMLVDFDDVYAMFHRRITVARWRKAVQEGLEQIVLDSTQGGRLLVINLHPWLTGHPFRIGDVEAILEFLTRHDRLWLTTTGDIADWFQAQEAKGAGAEDD